MKLFLSVLFFVLITLCCSQPRMDLGKWQLNKGSTVPCDHPVVGGISGLQKVLVARVIVGGDILPFGVFVNSSGIITSAPYIAVNNVIVQAKDYEILCGTKEEVAWQAMDPKYDYIPGNAFAAGRYVGGEMIYACRDLAPIGNGFVGVGRIDASSDKCRYVYYNTANALVGNTIGCNQEVLITI